MKQIQLLDLMSALVNKDAVNMLTCQNMFLLARFALMSFSY